MAALAASPLQRTCKRPQQFLALSGKLGRKYVKIVFSKKALFGGNKRVDQHLGANLKKRVFCKNVLQIFSFF